MHKTIKGLIIISVILLVLQTCVLCVYCIQNSDSKTFRITVMFLGLGLIITPLVLKGLGRMEAEKNLAGQWVGLFYLLYMLAGPWIQFSNRGAGTMTEFNYLAVASASIQLASSSFGFFITGMITAINPPVYDGTGLGTVPAVRLLRLLLSLGLLVLASYSILPVLSIIHPFFYGVNPFSTVPGSYGSIVAFTAGNPYIWLLNFMLGAFVYYRFYSDWIIKRKF